MNNNGNYRIALDLYNVDGSQDTIVLQDTESAFSWVQAIINDNTVLHCDIRSQATQDEVFNQISFENIFISLFK